MKITLRSAIGASLLVAFLGSAPVSADPVWSMTLPAGLACPDFDLLIEGYGDGPQVNKLWTDENNNPVRMLTAGTGYELVYTNLDTGQTFWSRSNGAVTQETYNGDGTVSATSQGHILLILFPDDYPPGPSTTLNSGRIVYEYDLTTYVFTVHKITGKQTDLCAVLSEY